MPAPANYKLPPAKKGETLYIVNPGGAVHLVTVQAARALFQKPGYRRASAEEIAALEKASGYQTVERPIATPFKRTLDVEIDPEAEAEPEAKPKGKKD